MVLKFNSLFVNILPIIINYIDKISLVREKYFRLTTKNYKKYFIKEYNTKNNIVKDNNFNNKNINSKLFSNTIFGKTNIIKCITMI